MNPLLIEQAPSAEADVPFSIKGERERMRAAFNARLRCPAHLPNYEALKTLMTDYELSARLRGVLPRQSAPSLATTD